MRLPTLLSTLAAAAVASAQIRTATIYIQPISPSSSSPAPLAEVQYDVADTSGQAEILSFEPPEIPEDAELVRIGAYDKAGARWVGSASVASVSNLGKGYSPVVTVSVDGKGEVLGAALKGVRIDAGQTRDFGPKAVVQVALPGKQPDLNKPVVLSPEGKKVVQEEKTFLQKYWWLIGIVVLMGLTGGGEK
ncbi:hypothetical protein NKR23_g7591 [Pleurostoma richardsiae]|uniref:Cyclin-dependent protein kinase regulator pho80 n=1 Tax=Pleurostoma richardsiae TaxID=41990 RepID=A0AA38R846_9PEZI|nr:hypothetical protein NKR23_g7591 [Pleurostoma richardsiae]